MPAMSVRSLVELFRSQPWDGDPRAMAQKIRRLSQFVALHGDKPIDELRPADLHLWIISNPRWRSNWTRRNVLDQIHHPFAWAARLRVIAADPFVGMSFPHGERGRPMTEQEFQTLLDNTRNPQFRWVLWFMRRTGCRPGEAAGLQWAHVEFDRCCATFHGKTSRMTGRIRMLVFPPVVMEMLAALRAVHKGRWVFLNCHGRQYRTATLDVMMSWVRKQAGISPSCKLYGLRHRYGTEAIRRNIDIKTLSELMGHTSVRTTEYYIHIAGRVDHLMGPATRAAE